MIKATEIRKGMAIVLEGVRYMIVDFQHVAKGNWRSYIQLKIRNLKTGQLLEERIRSTDTIEEAFMDSKELEYLYSQGKEHVFMDLDTYEQVPMGEDIVGEVIKWLKPNMMVKITSCDGQMIGIEPPNTVELKVVETPPVVKGATASPQPKDAIMETGVRVRVPGFIEVGELIRVDTRTGEYVERVKS